MSAGPTFDVGDKDTSDSPNSHLDVLDEAVETKADDEIVEGLGLGNYTAKEHWQQVESFKDGMFADAAFGSRLVERVVRDVVVELGENGYAYYDNDDDEPKNRDGWADLDDSQRDELFEDGQITRRTYVLERGAEIWSKLSDEQKQAAIEEIAGTEPGWTPPFWRMVNARHETSRSRGARLMDNVFGTRNVERYEGDMADAQKAIGGDQ